MMMVLLQVVRSWILLVIIFTAVCVRCSNKDFSSDQYDTRSIAHLGYLPVALQDDSQTQKENDLSLELEKLEEILHVPHYDKLVNLDLFFNSKISVILEDGEPGSPLSFSLETEKNQFGIPQVGSLSMYQISSFHNEDTLNVTVHVTDSPSWSPAMGVWTLCAGSLVAVFILYLVTLLPECSVTSEGEGLYQFAKL